MELFLTLEPEPYQLFEAALEYVRNHPLPDGERIIRVDRPPVALYYYRDDHYRIVYGLRDNEGEGYYDISIVAVDAL